MASDETMTKLALENMWQQWHAAPWKNGNKGKRLVYRWLQKGIDQYNELLKETVLNQNES
jgi:hypothetical protein